MKLLSAWRSRNAQALGKTKQAYGGQDNKGKQNKESTQEILNMNLTGTKNPGQMNIQDYEFGSSGKKYDYEDENDLDHNIENFSPEQDNLELEDIDFEDSNQKNYKGNNKAALFKQLGNNKQATDDLDLYDDNQGYGGSHSDRY